MIKSKYKPIIFALSAALLYGLSTPASKILLEKVSPMMMAALLYLGAGIGMSVIHMFTRNNPEKAREASIGKSDILSLALVVVLDIIAPILLMFGISVTSAENASLLNNFEIVATSMVALIIFKESISRRAWIAIALITAASFLLSVSDFSSFSFSLGSVYVLLACLAWGFENNFTRKLSNKNPVQIVIVKGLGSGLGALIIALMFSSNSFDLLFYLAALVLGFAAYGLSLYFYISAQRHLGAARTSAFYATSPFIGVAASWIFLKEPLTFTFAAALVLMIVGTYFIISEKHTHLHIHEHITHEHIHSHDDGHHTHAHENDDLKEHSHIHSHERTKHRHEHSPDTHHRHKH